MTHLGNFRPGEIDTYGWNFSGCTKPEFDVTFLVNFGTLFRWLKVVLWQKLKQFLKIYEWGSVYIPLFGPPMHWGAISRPVHFTLPQIFLRFHSRFMSFLSPVFGFWCHNINKYDSQPMIPRGHMSFLSDSPPFHPVKVAGFRRFSDMFVWVKIAGWGGFA